MTSPLADAAAVDNEQLEMLSHNGVLTVGGVCFASPMHDDLSATVESLRTHLANVMVSDCPPTEPIIAEVLTVIDEIEEEIRRLSEKQSFR